MSFWTKAEKEKLDVVTVRTKRNGLTLTAWTPGVAKILDYNGAALNWDVQNGYGISGARQLFRGWGLAEFQIEITMWEPEHRDHYDTVWKGAIEASRPGQPERVYEVEHPILAAEGIKNLVFLNIPLLQPDGDKDLVIKTYKCREWRPPAPALTIPTSAGNDSKNSKPVDEFRADVKAARAQALADLDEWRKTL